MRLHHIMAITGLGFIAALASTVPAAANGCNGVVNQLVWGCAAWDNNNGPKYPNYHAPAAAAPQPSLAPRSAPIMSNANGGFIGNNGGAFVGNNSRNRNGLITDNGGGLITQDGGGRPTGH